MLYDDNVCFQFLLLCILKGGKASPGFSGNDSNQPAGVVDHIMVAVLEAPVVVPFAEYDCRVAG